MSQLLEKDPYTERNDALFLREINSLSEFHIVGCYAYKRIWKGWEPAQRVEDVPFVHVGLFKRFELKTDHKDIVFKRTVQSSSTSGSSSKIVLDEKSSKFQAESAMKILNDFIGTERRPLLILDSVKSLRRRDAMPARVAAALSLKSIASDIVFLLDDPESADSMKWDILRSNLIKYKSLIVYGFSWILWEIWGSKELPEDIKKALFDKIITFVHSGGWKKLEAISVNSSEFNETLLRYVHSSSKVIDFYGLVEQMGIIYPICEYGSRHVPVWADVIVRDILTMRPLINEVGQLQLLNTITYGAPYHSILTEDVGRILIGNCPCGRKGRRFELLGRVPKAEIRGCANV